MAFLLNGEQINLNGNTQAAKFIRAGKEKIIEKYNLNKSGKFIRFVYPDNLIKPNRDNKGKVDKPAGIAIEYREIIESSERGTEDWRYYEVRTPKGGNVFEYSPLSEEFQGNLVLTINNIDKIFFFLYICGRVEGSDNQSKNKKIYMKVDDPVDAATKRINKEKTRTLVEAKIYNDFEDGGLKEEVLRKIASSLFIRDAQIKDLPLVKVELLEHIKRMKDGYEKFLELEQVDKIPEAIMKATIQEAIDIGIIGFNGKSKSYHYKSGIAYQEVIIKPIGPKDSTEQLYDYLQRKQVHYDMIKSLILAKKAKKAQKELETA